MFMISLLCMCLLCMRVCVHKQVDKKNRDNEMVKIIQFHFPLQMILVNANMYYIQFPDTRIMNCQLYI